LWSILQLADCFELTGRPLDDSDIEGMLEWAKRQRIYMDIVSGDYKAATDNLHPYLCARTLARICYRWRIPYEEALNMMSCLANHVIDDRQANSYKMNKLTGRLDDNGGAEYLLTNAGDFHLQVWGQLMGSPVSFPILCIINAAITRDSMEKALDRKISLQEKAFKVNGDDVVFPLPPREYQRWVSAVTSAGLKPSIGKNYISHRYAVINSQLYDCGNRWDWMEEDRVRVQKVPLVKMNLVYCQQHSTTERRKDEMLVIGENIRHGKTLEGRMNELVNGFDGDLREELLSRAYYYARPVLDLLPPVSWVLPKCLGGLGLPARKGHVVSELHLKIASVISCLDDKARRDMVRLQWLKEPGNIFCQETNSQIAEINEELGFKPVLADYKQEDVIYGRLIRSNLGLGVDEIIQDSKKILKIWNNTYSNWVRRVQKVKWAKNNSHEEKGLHPMSQAKAMEFGGKVWTVDGAAKWD
jgi:hypothetical protein